MVLCTFFVLFAPYAHPRPLFVRAAAHTAMKPYNMDSIDSFDDLDNSLDKALNRALNTIFTYNTPPSVRQSSSGSNNAIPLSTMVGHERDSRDYENDSSPLIGGRTSIDTRRAVRGEELFFQRFINFFQRARKELNDERIRAMNAKDTTDSRDQRQFGERYISPRDNSRKSSYPTNAVSNAKYNPITFIPIILYEQFKFFFNLYFLLVALSQIVPQLRIGYLSSYIVPLAFVLTVTMLKEALDDLSRRHRDREQNNELYEVLNRASLIAPEAKLVQSKNLKVGDLVRLHKDTRVPADMILLQTSEKDGTGEAFIKTDQLDGETDWKLRVALNATQSLTSISQLTDSISLIVSEPTKSIHSFAGKLIHRSHQPDTSSSDQTYPLTIDQTLWANTVLALGLAIGIVIYTGYETRQLLNTTKTGVKTGLLELEINKISKILCIVVLVLSVALVLAHGWPLKSTWYIDILRFLILFSTIIPVSLRVNLDLAKSVYASQIQRDYEIEGTIVRTSTIPEDLGRIEYLLSDKTGTLTQNDMELKKLHLGSVSYSGDTLDMVGEYVAGMLSLIDTNHPKKRDLSGRVCDLVLTLALCHNVTPTYDEEDSDFGTAVTYQAASPDETAIVKFTELVGLKLVKRDRQSITLYHTSSNTILDFEILYIFPFSSETKRMGIVVKDIQRNEVWFMQKGADTVMAPIVTSSDWLDEETGNMAREGLRTLVIGRKKLGSELFQEFVNKYQKASVAMHEREASMQRVISQLLEQDLELLGLTGVEDKLQMDVKTSIELLRNAGLKIWMLTGDKVETAKCVSISARLIYRGQYVHQITKLSHPDMALPQLEYLKSDTQACLLIDGESLAVYLKHYRQEFLSVVIHLPAVIACRCTPQQKADVALLIKETTGKRVCCIGDGGNDVSMIQCADVGVGIVGKEGKQASLAADFSIDQFCYLQKLLLWHGRNSYKRSAKLAQFVIHRGLLISVAQAVYSICSKFEPLALYQGWLMVGYATLYTMAPVFSLTLDCDIDEHLTRLYPELYRELTLGKALSYKTFFMWVLISLYQGVVIQLLSQKFDGIDPSTFKVMVALLFSALVYNELIMVGLQINKWNRIMMLTIIITFMIYVGSIPFLGDYYDLDYVTSFSYIWHTAVILVVSLLPVWVSLAISRRIRPPTYAKVQQD